MSRRKKLWWQNCLVYLVIILLSLSVVAWQAKEVLKKLYLEQVGATLKAHALLVKGLAAGNLSEENSRWVNTLCREAGSQLKTRITVILPSGQVIGDSEEDPAHMGNHGIYPEFQKALAGDDPAISTRYSFELKKELLYLAYPIKDKERRGEIEGIIRVAAPLPSTRGLLMAIIYPEALVYALVLGLLAAVVSLIISRPVDLSFAEIEKGIQHFTSGDLDYRLPVPHPEEMGSLADGMNRMAGQMDDQIRTITQQKNELEAVLSSMDEAVLVVDMNERIIRFNRAAACLFKIQPQAAQGRSIQEVIRNTDLHRLIAKTFSSQEPVEGDIVLYHDTERFLQAHGTALRDPKGERVGVLIVLNNITRLKLLEKIRRDFVANVSHELKTPITSIKGFVETLRDGAIGSPEDRMRFLEIIARHTDRLNAIIDDLLSLSRIEEETEKEQIALEEGRIKEVLRSAILICAQKAAEKQIEVELACDDELVARINMPLLEQAVVNLIDNAIKYSAEGGRIQVEAKRIAGEVVIRVQDQGCGIPREHLSRIFERFYRVDKARSRKLGGTGLGLAIVKHIVQAHSGRILVESAPNKGSTFSICLPTS